MTEERTQFIRSKIRDVPDFPKPGILFKDITPVLADPRAFNLCLDLFAERFDATSRSTPSSASSRAASSSAPRSPRACARPSSPRASPASCLPPRTRSSYELEYGSDAIEMHRDAVSPGEQVLIVDDLIATGGTAWAACELVRKLGADVIGAAFVIELTFLPGRVRLSPVETYSLLTY